MANQPPDLSAGLRLMDRCQTQKAGRRNDGNASDRRPAPLEDSNRMPRRGPGKKSPGVVRQSAVRKMLRRGEAGIIRRYWLSPGSTECDGHGGCGVRGLVLPWFFPFRWVQLANQRCTDFSATGGRLRE